jgi:hypothetical protein
MTMTDEARNPRRQALACKDLSVAGTRLIVEMYRPSPIQGTVAEEAFHSLKILSASITRNV